MQSRTPEETKAIIHWRNQNRRTLRHNYQQQYIACGTSEVLAAGASYDFVEAAAMATNKPFIIDWIPEAVGEVNFYWVKFYGLKKEAWEPLHPVLFIVGEAAPVEYRSKQREVLMVVDSGAEVSLISKTLGEELGFSVAYGEKIEIGQGVGGEIEYINRIIDISIAGHTFKAPVAWILSEVGDTPLLLGREVVFDLFDIKFVKAEERIEFEWRGGQDAKVDSAKRTLRERDND
jgi:Aspartyl protease